MLIVGLGGTLRPGSSTERVLLHVLRHARALDAETALFVGEDINLPMYVPHAGVPGERAAGLIALRDADDVIIGSPGYYWGHLRTRQERSRLHGGYGAGRGAVSGRTGGGLRRHRSRLAGRECHLERLASLRGRS